MTRVTIHYECLTNDDDMKVGLYSVIITTPHKGTETHFVLAKDETEASDMARCAMGVASYHVTEEIEPMVKTFVTRLPLTVAGWGKIKY